MNRIITIGREFGSGGREIGRRLAQAMKIAYYDQEIVTALINKNPKAEEYIRYMATERPLPLLPITTAHTFGMPINYAVAKGLSFYIQESKIIQEAAEKTDCVIVGRCADYVLQDMKPIRIFVYADIRSKIARCRKKGDDAAEMTDKELKQKIASIDRKRAHYYQFYTKQNWGDKANYDLCINTTNAEIKKIVLAIERFMI